jgi:hypothetical protein
VLFNDLTELSEIIKEDLLWPWYKGIVVYHNIPNAAIAVVAGQEQSTTDSLLKIFGTTSPNFF